jgi:hypothetical protein
MKVVVAGRVSSPALIVAGFAGCCVGAGVAGRADVCPDPGGDD